MRHIADIIDERDCARRIAVALEQENAHLTDTLRTLRAACQPGAPLLTIDGVADTIDRALGEKP